MRWQLERPKHLEKQWQKKTPPAPGKRYRLY